MPAASHGFTLMEMIVVMFIIGIIATFAVTSLSRDPADLVEEEARRLHALLQLASEEAVMQSEELAIEFHTDGYRFMRLESNGEQWTWVPLSRDRIFRPRCLHDLVHMEVALEGEGVELVSMGCATEMDHDSDVKDKDKSAESAEEDQAYPRIFVLSSGELTPFEITLPVNDEGAAFRLVGYMHGEMRFLRPGEALDDA